MRYLFLDTETTGLPTKRSDPLIHPENWPRMVQIAWILCDDQGSILDEQTHIVYPDGYIIPDIVARIHGITTERAQIEGEPLHDVLSGFTDAVLQSELIIGHNIEFDRGVIAAEYTRTDQIAHIHSRSYFCTMKKTAEICKILYPSGKTGHKWPKLGELHQNLFSSPFEGAHDALADVRACFRCYFELKRRGMIQKETIPVSKNNATQPEKEPQINRVTTERSR